MWVCKNCGGKNIVRYVCGSFSGYEKELNKHSCGEIELSDISEIDFFGSFECTDCGSSSDEINDIAEWVDENE